MLTMMHLIIFQVNLLSLLMSHQSLHLGAPEFIEDEHTPEFTVDEHKHPTIHPWPSSGMPLILLIMVHIHGLIHLVAYHY